MKRLFVAAIITVAFISAGLIWLLAPRFGTSQQPTAVVSPTSSAVSSPQRTSVQPTTAPSASFSQASPATFTPTENLAASSTIDTSNWKTYRNEKYGFQLRYPTNWLLTANVAEPDIPYSPLHVDNIVSVRKVGSASYPESQTVPASAAVYLNSSNLSLSEWLSGVYGKELSKVKPGRIQQALASAYAGTEGTVSFNELRSGDVDVAEVGRVSGGVLFYSGFFAKNKSPYLYVVELRLTFNKSAEPADAVYADMFGQMLSSFLMLN